MKYFLITLVLVAVIITAGCVRSGDKNIKVATHQTTPAPSKMVPTIPTKPVTTVPTLIALKPTISAKQAKSIAGITISMTAQTINMSKDMVTICQNCRIEKLIRLME